MNSIENDMVKNVYEKIAPHFSNTRTYQWSWIIEFFDSLKDNSMVYDIGCGNGRNMTHNNLYFIGVDNCANFLKICMDKKLAVVNSNITKIALQDNTADAIICIAVLHHLYTEENRLLALLEMKRLLKSGGKILLSVWSINQPKKTRRSFKNYGNNIVLWNQYGEIYERYYYIFKIEELKSLFKKAGLIVINYKYDCGNEIFTLMKL